MSEPGFIEGLRQAVRGHLARHRKQTALAQAYARVFDGPEGRLVLTDILRQAGLLEIGYGEGGKAEDAVFHEGRRFVGLEIIQRLRWSEGELLELARERTTEQLNDAREGAEDEATT